MSDHTADNMKSLKILLGILVSFCEVEIPQCLEISAPFSLFQTSPLLIRSQLLCHLHSFVISVINWCSGTSGLFTISCDACTSDLIQNPSSLSPCPKGGDLLHPAVTGLRPEEEDGERSDMAFLKDLLSPGPGSADEFSREWQDAFGLLDAPSVPPAGTGAASTSVPDPAARPSSNPPSPTGFLPSQLLDHSLSSTGETHCPLLEG